MDWWNTAYYNCYLRRFRAINKKNLRLKCFIKKSILNVVCYTEASNDKEISFDIVLFIRPYDIYDNFIDYISLTKVHGSCDLRKYSIKFHLAKTKDNVYIFTVFHYNSSSNLGCVFHYKFHLQTTELRFNPSASGEIRQLYINAI